MVISIQNVPKNSYTVKISWHVGAAISTNEVTGGKFQISLSKS